MVDFVLRLFGGRRQAERDLAKRVATFRAEVEAAGTADDSGIEALEARREALGLSEDDVALELEMLEGLQETLALARAAAAGSLPIVETNHRVLGTDTCYFAAPASALDRSPDQTGKLFLTDRRAVFMGGGVTSVGWGSVMLIGEDRRDIVLQHAGRPTPYRFRCNSFVDSKRGVFTAKWLKERTRTADRM